MNRSLSKVPRLLRWRYLRWVACSAVIPALWACNSRRLAIPDPAPAIIDTRQFKQSVNHKLDILFMVDDSSSMAPLQAKMQAQLPAFMDALADDTGKLPDLHVGVVSSSYGGGAWSNVNQCHAASTDPNTLGDDQGRLLQGAIGPNPSPCTMLHSGEKYLRNGDGSAADPPNFDGDIRNAFKCIALLGDKGCGFESQFESVYYGLYKGSLPLGSGDNQDPDNGGFLRPEAVLAIVMVTNEDDCSVRGDSLLLNPAVNSVDDKTGLGALQSYRCNEFGHVCDGMPPPHNPPGSIVTLNNCVSAEEMGKTDDGVVDPGGHPDPTKGHLWPTVNTVGPDQGFTEYIKSYKSNPDDILVAAIAGPTTDAQGKSLYRVKGEANSSANNEIDPIVDHSCTQQTAGDPEYADPAVRIKQWVDNFGANGVFYPICANDFSMAMVGIARKIHAKLGSSCVSTKIAVNPMDPTKHNCQVTQKTTESSGKVSNVQLPECDAGFGQVPCFQLVPNSDKCTDPNAKTLFRVCNDPSCATPPGSMESKDANIACSVE
jgi:hypothetical protein